MNNKPRTTVRKKSAGPRSRKNVERPAPKAMRAKSPRGEGGKERTTVSQKPEAEVSEKLQKVLARAGFASRREIETWIEQGRININQRSATLGDRVTPSDRVSIDGKPVSEKRLFGTQQRVIIYNKDFGSICTRADPEQRKTIFEDLPHIKGGRWISIGRLDINTSGLLLLTTDGELANRLMHPSFEIEREYLVRVLGEVSDDILRRLQQGVELDDGKARFEQIHDVGGEGANHWYRVVLREGRKREVRRLWESQGIQVSRLTRIRFGNIEIPRRLQRGQWEELTGQQLDGLRRMAGLESDTPAPERSAKKTVVKKAGVKKKAVRGRKSFDVLESFDVRKSSTSRKPSATRNSSTARKPKAPSKSRR